MKKRYFTLVILPVFIALNTLGNYSIVRFDNNWCSSSYPSGYSTGSFSITETDINGNNGNNGLTKNQTNKTIQIDLPSGFEFKITGTTAAITASGTEITVVSFSFPSATRLLVTLTTSSVNAEYNTLFFNDFEIRAMVAGASGNMLRTGGNFKIDNSSANPTSTQPFGILTSGTPFAYSSSSADQPNLTDVSQYSINNVILRIKVSGTGDCGSTLNQLTFSTDGNNGTGTDSTYNITQAKVFYTGNSSVYTTSKIYGLTTSPAGIFTISGTADLLAGDNYFWLCYDVPGDAYTNPSDNKLDASLISFVINGMTLTDMSSPSPVGYRKIIPAKYYYSRFSGNWTENGIWATVNNGPSCNCQPNGAGIVEIDTAHAITMNVSRTVDVLEIRKDASLKGMSASLLFTATTAINTYDNGYFSFPGDINNNGNVTLKGTGISDFQKDFNIDGDLYIESGAILINSTQSSLDMTIGGNLTVYGLLQDASSNNIVMDGGNAFIGGTGKILGAKNVIIRNGDKTVQATADLYLNTGFLFQGPYVLDNFGKMNIRGNMDADNSAATWINEENSYLSYGGSATMFATSGFLEAFSNLNTVSYSGTTNQNIILSEFVHYYNLVLEGGGIKTLLSNVHLHGDFTTNAQFNANGKSITFHGDDMEFISGTVAPTLYDMVMLNSGPGLTLNTSVFISHDLLLTSGKIYTSMTNLLTENDNATASGGSVLSFVHGPMKKTGNDAFVYPVGKNNVYARIGISAPQNVLSEFIAEYFDNAYSNTTSVTPPLDHVSKVEYWDLLRNIGTDSVKVKLYWEDAVRSGINDYSSNLTVAGWDATSWFDRGQSSVTAADPGNLTSDMVKSFGPFTFGSRSSNSNPLPVVYLNYNASYSDDKVVVSWTTASETNNDYFWIERSVGLNDYMKLGVVKGAGNSNVPQEYFFTDLEPGTGTVYYRIRQTDYDGNSDATEWMAVSIVSSGQISVFADNSSGHIIVSFGNDNDSYNINIYDMTGNCISRNIRPAGDGGTFNISLQGIAQGIYIVNISSKNNRVTRKIVMG